MLGILVRLLWSRKKVLLNANINNEEVHARPSWLRNFDLLKCRRLACVFCFPPYCTYLLWPCNVWHIDIHRLMCNSSALLYNTFCAAKLTCSQIVLLKKISLSTSHNFYDSNKLQDQDQIDERKSRRKTFFASVEDSLRSDFIF